MCEASQKINACSYYTCLSWRRRLASHPLFGSLGKLHFIGADEYAWWPGVGHEAAANKGHGEEVLWAARIRQEARNGHGMQHGMSAMEWKER